MCLTYGDDDSEKPIEVKGWKLELAVSWKKHKHLSFSPDGGYLYLNIQTMAADLARAFDKLREELISSSTARDCFLKMMKRGIVVKVQRAEEIAAWKGLRERLH